MWIFLFFMIFQRDMQQDARKRGRVASNRGSGGWWKAIPYHPRLCSIERERHWEKRKLEFNFV
jgi:hypothetical protein